MAKRAREFRELLRTQTPVVAASAYDGLSARIIQHFGLHVVYMGDAVISKHLGMREAVMDVHDMIGEAARIAEVVDIPVMVDGGNGYGEAIHTARMIRMMEQYGIAGTTIDDAEAPRAACSYQLVGKQVTRIVPLDEHLDKLKAALDARQDPDFVIVGRTDAGLEATQGVVGGGFDEAVRRCNAMMEIGVDMVHFRSHLADNTERLAKALPGVPIKCTAPRFPDGKVGAIEWAKKTGIKLLHAAPLTFESAFRAVYESVKHFKETGELPLLNPDERGLLHEILGEPDLLKVERNTIRGARYQKMS